MPPCKKPRPYVNWDACRHSFEDTAQRARETSTPQGARVDTFNFWFRQQLGPHEFDKLRQREFTGETPPHPILAWDHDDAYFRQNSIRAF